MLEVFHVDDDTYWRLLKLLPPQWRFTKPDLGCENFLYTFAAPSVCIIPKSAERGDAEEIKAAMIRTIEDRAASLQQMGVAGDA